MVINPTLQRAFKKVGGGIGRLALDYYYTYVVDFPTIAVAGNSTQLVRVDGGAAFQVDEIAAAFQLNGVFATAIDGTPLPATANAQGSTNTMPTLAHLRAYIQVTDRPWMNLPARLDTLVGNSLTRNYPSIRPIVPGNETINVTIYNDGPAIVKGQLVFIGRRMSVAVPGRA